MSPIIFRICNVHFRKRQRQVFEFLKSILSYRVPLIKPKLPPLIFPGEWDAFEEAFHIEINRLRAVENGFDDVGGEEGKAKMMSNIAFVHTFITCD
ncbi:MAG: hypothetical protein COA65_01395 [Rhodospirillaceae bacterium]|nr:MAG: hypothetical protein COA65_01395 [Rhodospirillaceae bacterium]